MPLRWQPFEPRQLKEAGPYARLREGGGEGESRYGAATRVALSGDEPSAMPVVDGRRGFGAADLAIEVFESWVPALVRVLDTRS